MQEEKHRKALPACAKQVPKSHGMLAVYTGIIPRLPGCASPRSVKAIIYINNNMQPENRKPIILYTSHTLTALAKSMERISGKKRKNLLRLACKYKTTENCHGPQGLARAEGFQEDS